MNTPTKILKQYEALSAMLAHFNVENYPRTYEEAEVRCRDLSDIIITADTQCLNWE